MIRLYTREGITEITAEELKTYGIAGMVRALGSLGARYGPKLASWAGARFGANAASQVNRFVAVANPYLRGAAVGMGRLVTGTRPLRETMGAGMISARMRQAFGLKPQLMSGNKAFNRNAFRRSPVRNALRIGIPSAYIGSKIFGGGSSQQYTQKERRIHAPKAQ